MRHWLQATTLLFVLPPAAHAQFNISLPTLERPVLRANIAGYDVSAGLDAGGVDLRVNDVSINRRGTIATATRRPSTTTTTTSRTPTSTRTTRTGTSSRASATASAVINTADNYIGTPYVWGGTTPRGFDCSGFVQYVFRKHGIELPRTSRQQVQVGERVPADIASMEPGDLMFFASNGSRIDHIAIYVGNNEILHSSKSGNGVGYDDLTSRRGSWFVEHHVASRRVIENGYSIVGELTAALRAFAEYDPPDRAPSRR
jgi:cell wall-associated NlpC family hydrolase